MKNINKLWIDCDPGADDAIALVTAFKEERFEIVGISSVNGNVSAEVGKDNIYEICRLFNLEIPVYKGEEKSLTNGILENHRIRRNELGYYVNKNKYEEESLSASEAIYFATKDIDKLDILALGPTTNIAKAILEHPDIVDKLGDIYIMGGSLKGGNITGNSEFNVYMDPKALNILLENNLQIFLFSLDITEQFGFSEEDLQQINIEETEYKNLMKDIIDFLLDERSSKNEAIFIHDIFPLYGYIFKDGVIYEQIKIRADESNDNRGKLLVDEAGTEVYYAVKLNEDNFKGYLKDILI